MVIGITVKIMMRFIAWMFALVSGFCLIVLLIVFRKLDSIDDIAVRRISRLQSRAFLAAFH